MVASDVCNNNLIAVSLAMEEKYTYLVHQIDDIVILVSVDLR